MTATKQLKKSIEVGGDERMSEKKEEQQPNEFQIMDTKDENQIITEMQGETALIEEYVYSFKQGGRQVTSLSYAGIKEMVRRRGHYEILDLKTEETDGMIRATVKIRDCVNSVEFLGAAEADKNKPFAFVLAVNKAERNAYRKAMPAEFLAKMVNAFLQSKPGEKPFKPPASDTEEKIEQVKQQERPSWEQMAPSAKGPWEKNTDLSDDDVTEVLGMMDAERKDSVDVEGFRYWRLSRDGITEGLG
jgi:hypothetical protein